MSDLLAQLKALIDEMNAITDARIDALMAALLAIKAQPNFDHLAFVQTLARLDVGVEGVIPRTPNAQKVYDQTIERLGLLPGQQTRAP